MEKQNEKVETTEIKTVKEAHKVMNDLYLHVKQFDDNGEIAEGEKGVMDLGDLDSSTLMRAIELCGHESKFLHKQCSSLEQDLEQAKAKIDELSKMLAKERRKKF